jgi:cytochrome P450
MLEVFRNSSIVPLGVFHSAMVDVPSFHGYEIPKGTVVMGNLYSVHHDKATWGKE